MFGGLTKKFGDWLAAKAFEKELFERLRTDAWLRETYINVNQYLNDKGYAETNPSASVFQRQTTPEFRTLAARIVGLQLLAISKSQNKVLECRRWMIDVMAEYAPVRALYTLNQTYESERAQGIRHELTTGLFEEFGLYAPKVYAHYFPNKAYQGTRDNNEELRQLSIAYHFSIDIGNVARIGLDDAGPWFREYFNVAVALAEANLKPDGNYASAILGEERESLRMEILNVGNAH